MNGVSKHFFLTLPSRLRRPAVWINPWPAGGMGGGERFCPLQDLLDDPKETVDIDAKFSVPYPERISRPSLKLQRYRRDFFDEMMLSIVMSCHVICRKNGKYSKAPRIHYLKVKHKWKTPKDVKLNALQNGYLRCLKLFYFDTNIQNFHFWTNEWP